MVAGVLFGWFDEPRKAWTLIAAAVLFVVFATMSVHSWTWLRWLQKRERLVRLLIEERVKRDDDDGASAFP
jgi:hypothetical protein